MFYEEFTESSVYNDTRYLSNLFKMVDVDKGMQYLGTAYEPSRSEFKNQLNNLSLCKKRKIFLFFL